MKPPEKIVVIVHPHVMEHGLDTVGQFNFLTSAQRQKVGYPPRTTQVNIMGNASEAARYLAPSNLLHRFYKAQIDDARRTPGTMVVVVRHRFKNDLPSMAELMGTGMSLDAAGRAIELMRDVQDRVASYARRLGKRAHITSKEPHLVGTEIKLLLASKGVKARDVIPVEIIGEAKDICVDVTRGGFHQAGFKLARIVESKTVG